MIPFHFYLFILGLVCHASCGTLRQLTHYLNGFMKNTTDLSSMVADFKVKVAILKKAKDQLLKAVREASDRAKAAE